MNYWRWNSKKKFLWNLIQVPIVIILITIISNSDYVSPLKSKLVISLLVLITILSLVYNYIKMKNCDRNEKKK
ncbi:hypothetical protein Pryu01_02478 [Paraliobacillus ryukyuensis]|uniref:Uncharacterized protein n=1 Tax=Paraliobacillus ryukyuensis TaxID=200904 RepID=A0A366DUE8_9BACI|nr:hypothetical protein DES48_11145 [Paraliobacillus ryukyuensis]